MTKVINTMSSSWKKKKVAICASKTTGVSNLHFKIFLRLISFITQSSSCLASVKMEKD